MPLKSKNYDIFKKYNNNAILYTLIYDKNILKLSN